MLRRAVKRGRQVAEKGDALKKSLDDDCDPVDLQSSSDVDKDAEESHLERAVLGDAEDIVEEITKHSKKKKLKKIKDPPKAPAWLDDEDASEEIQSPAFGSWLRIKGNKITKEQYQSKLNNEFDKVTGRPTWARLQWEKESEEEQKEMDSDPEVSDLLQSTGDYLTSSAFLSKGVIQMKACADANKESPAQGKLNSVEFHPTAQVLLAAGMDQRISLFQIDGEHNPKIQSIFLDRFPIFTAHFSADGKEVIAGSRHKSFYSYDMMAGKIVNIPWIKALEERQMKRFTVSPDGKFLAFYGSYGKIHLLSSQSKEYIATLKMNGSVEAVSFNNQGDTMCSHGDDGDVYVWDMKTRDCVHHFKDDGCLSGLSLAHSPNGRYLAAGSSSGVVNIYDHSYYTDRYPKPLKAIMNLTTATTHLRFNATSEILAMASNCAEKGVKLLHVPSLTAFSNFPERTDNFRIPYSMDFSLNSGYFCIGNNTGRAVLYRVQHYDNY